MFANSERGCVDFRDKKDHGHRFVESQHLHLTHSLLPKNNYAALIVSVMIGQLLLGPCMNQGFRKLTILGSSQTLSTTTPHTELAGYAKGDFSNIVVRRTLTNSQDP